MMYILLSLFGSIALEVNSRMYFICDVTLLEWMFEFLHFHSACLNDYDMLCPAV